jgi:hypothetical protein
MLRARKFNLRRKKIVVWRREFSKKCTRDKYFINIPLMYLGFIIKLTLWEANHSEINLQALIVHINTSVNQLQTSTLKRKLIKKNTYILLIRVKASTWRLISILLSIMIHSYFKSRWHDNCTFYITSNCLEDGHKLWLFVNYLKEVVAYFNYYAKIILRESE